WLDTAGPQPPRRSTESRSGRPSCTVLDVMDRIFPSGLTRMLSYSIPAAGRSAVGCKPCDLVGVAGFEPAASSSRTSGAAGRLSVVPANPVCQWSRQLMAVRGRCCTSALYLATDPLLAKEVAATGGPAAAQVKRGGGCSVSNRELPGVTLLT